MIKKLVSYFGLERFGWLECVMALYPILAGYGYGSFKLAFGVLFILDVIIFFIGYNKRLKCLPLALFCSFLILHYIVFIPVLPDLPSYYVNSLISTIIYTVSLFVIAPQLDYRKFRSAINVVAIICMIGMIYHVALLSFGKSVSPIKLPFLPDMAQNTRLYAVNNRPSSFFWEPQSYASFMLVPLFFALYERKMLFAFIIAVLMMVSTSTTGLILAILMFLLFLVFSRNKWYTIIIYIVSVVALVYFLLSSTYTMAGLEKFNNFQIEESNRVLNGILIVRGMNVIDLLLGIPFANLQDAYEAGYFTTRLIVFDDGVLFVSAIWIALIQFGILGLFLFVWPYFWIYKKDAQILPFLICIVVGHFSAPDFMGASYVFQVLVMLAFISRDNQTLFTK